MSAYAPERGDIVWLRFDSNEGHEQSGRRPALVISPKVYNRKVGLAIFCPITSQRKGYPFEVVIPEGSKATGVVLADQAKSLDWRVRGAKRICPAPDGVVDEVSMKLMALVAPTGR